MDFRNFKNKKVTVMGLGLNGGGLACVRYMAERGAQVTATDLRTEEILAPTLESLSDLNVRYVLGEHRMEDFSEADLVIKNPAVPSSSPFLKAAARVETDLSLFLSICSNPVIAVTGSKGKSTVVSALFHILKKNHPGCRLGGNITRSPLSFLDELNPGDPIILELSSWQLGDLKGRDLLHPEISVLTNIMNDHQNMYDDFEDYVDDKKVVYRGQNKDQKAIFLLDERGKGFAAECSAETSFYSPDNSEAEIRLEGKKGWFNHKEKEIEILPEKLKTPGVYFRLNCLIAGAVAVLYGEDSDTVITQLADFPGIPHRLELVREYKGIRFYNDTTATIPEAMTAAVESFEEPVKLICGGTDKELDFSGTAESLKKAAEIYILEGTAFEKLTTELKNAGIKYNGPYSSLKEAFDSALESAAAGDILLLSPGTTSFGMFINEFHRGDSFRELAEGLK
jgi:UDP-N-acetylmuramoylalanine--D-glutamate ligase